MGKAKTLVVWEPRTERIIGTAQELETTLRAMHAAGRLYTPAQRIAPVRVADNRHSGRPLFLVTVEGLFPKTIVPWWRRLEQVAWLLVPGGITVAWLGLIVTLALHLVTSVWAPALIVLALIVLWVLASIKRGHPCRGLHCGGCPDN